MGLTNFSPQLDVASLNAILQDAVDPLMRESAMFGGFETYGRMRFGVKRKQLEWDPKIRRATPVAVDPYDVHITFPKRERRIKATQGWCQAVLGEAIAEIDRLCSEDGGKQIDLVEDAVRGVGDDFKEWLKEQPFNDGGATPLQWDGFETIGATNGLISGGYVGDPNDTYAGHDTDLGAVGGSKSSGTWPHTSVHTPDYSAWSPMWFDTQNTQLVTDYSDVTSAVFRQTYWYGLNFVSIHMGRTQKRNTSAGVCSAEEFRQIVDGLRDKEQIIIQGKSKMVDLGYEGVRFNGLELLKDFWCPSGVVYLFQWDNVGVLSPASQLIMYDEDHEITTGEDLKAVKTFSQMRIKIPGYVGGLRAISAGS